MARTPEPVVAVRDLIGDMFRGRVVTDDEARIVADLYRVDLTRDYRNEWAVSLSDAYVIRDRVLAEQAELAAKVAEQDAFNEQVVAWQRARDAFWHDNWISFLRQQPPRNGAQGGHEAQVNAARAEMSKITLAAEQSAGIPKDVLLWMRWPEWTFVYRYPDPNDRPGDLAYKPPTL
ncbi:hypothetical protein GCM10027053_03890 [Intrasporangium mesophilum]